MNTSTALPDTARLHEIVAPYIAGEVHVTPITSRDGAVLGNNGDTLMHRVFTRILDGWGVVTTADASAADVIVVPPNGALLESYSYPEILAERLRGHEDTPVVLFPSSALFPTRDPSFMFAGRRAPTVWILRERFSFEHLVERWGEGLRRAGVELVLDHDVVASGNRHVAAILGGTAREKHVLIAGRIDSEARDGGAARPAPSRPTLIRRAFGLVPYGRVSTAVARRARASKLSTAAERLVANTPEALQLELARAAPKRVVRVDASATQFLTFDEYASAVRDAAIVITDRLHVGLPAAVLGKRVIIVEAGYHKLEGVYLQSLRDLPNVSFVDPGKRDPSA